MTVTLDYEQITLISRIITMNALERIDAIESRLDALQQMLGVTIDDWVPTGTAAKRLQVSQGMVGKLVATAETARATRKPYPMKYGVHYRQLPGSSHWQVNWAELKELINNMPPEKWGEVE